MVESENEINSNSAEEKSGIDDFSEASDEFYKYLARLLREEMAAEQKDMDRLQDLAGLIKKTNSGMKEKKEKQKKEIINAQPTGSRTDRKADERRGE